jgi:hypothetical protein
MLLSSPVARAVLAEVVRFADFGFDLAFAFALAFFGLAFLALPFFDFAELCFFAAI